MLSRRPAETSRLTEVDKSGFPGHFKAWVYKHTMRCMGQPTQFRSLTEEFVVTRTRDVMQYRDSKDPKIAVARNKVCTGRK